MLVPMGFFITGMSCDFDKREPNVSGRGGARLSADSAQGTKGAEHYFRAGRLLENEGA